MEIRDALEDDRSALWALAKRSKAAWGYSEEFMAACAEELRPRDLSMAGVCVSGGTPVGFYTLELDERDQLELGHLFVDPACWGQGVGGRLMLHARSKARALDFRHIVIQGDPHARGFYQRCGAVLTGERESGSIPGRMLPVFVLRL